MSGNGSGSAANACERKIVGNNSTPAGGAEMDRLARHGAVLYLVAQAARIRESLDGESQE